MNFRRTDRFTGTYAVLSKTIKPDDNAAKDNIFQKIGTYETFHRKENLKLQTRSNNYLSNTYYMVKDSTD